MKAETHKLQVVQELLIKVTMAVLVVAINQEM
jgi:hypothetical protein